MLSPINHQIIAYIYVTYIKESLHFSWGLAIFLLYLPNLRLNLKFYLAKWRTGRSTENVVFQLILIRRPAFDLFYFLLLRLCFTYLPSRSFFEWRNWTLKGDRPGESDASRKSSYPLSMFVCSVVFETRQKKKKQERRLTTTSENWTPLTLHTSLNHYTHVFSLYNCLQSSKSL